MSLEGRTKTGIIGITKMMLSLCHTGRIPQQGGNPGAASGVSGGRALRGALTLFQAQYGARQ